MSDEDRRGLSADQIQQFTERLRLAAQQLGTSPSELAIVWSLATTGSPARSAAPYEGAPSTFCSRTSPWAIRRPLPSVMSARHSCCVRPW
jgi:hypothetical protein